MTASTVRRASTSTTRPGRGRRARARRLRPLRAWRRCGSTRRPSCRCARRRGRDGEPARAVDGPARPDRRHELPDGRAASRARGARAAGGRARRHRALPEVAERQARDAGHATEEELLLLTTHGILHLLGYDHAEPDEEQRDVRAAAPAPAHLPRRPAAARPPDVGTPHHDRLVTAGGRSPPSSPFLHRRRRGRASRGCRAPGPTSCSTRAGPAREGAACSVVGDTAALPVASLSFLRVIAESTVAVMVTLAVVDCVDGTGERLPRRHRRSWRSSRSPSSVSRPGTLGTQHSTRVALAAAPATVCAAARARAVRRAAHRADNAVTPGKGFRDGPFASESELRDLVDMAERLGAHRGGRARDDPLRLRARRHPRPRGHGAAHRHGRRSTTTGSCRQAMTPVPALGLLPDPGAGRRRRRRRRAALPQGRHPPAQRRPRGRGGAGRRADAPDAASCPRASRSTTCCARCSATRPTSPSSSTSTAAPPAW